MLLKKSKKDFTLLLAGILTVTCIGTPYLSAKADETSGTEYMLQVSDKGETSDLEGIGSGISNMFDSAPDNTWLFAGGVETQGRFAEIRGARNFVGQFEEYIRWTKASNNEQKRQRYMINVGKAGQDIITFEKKLDGYLLSLDPKAVAYMIGEEDYGKGDEGLAPFKKALAAVIEKTLATRKNGGFVVIQLPHAVKDVAATVNIEKYIRAAKEVISNVDSSGLSRVRIADHYTQTNDNDFKNTKLTEEGRLNADGHYEIAKQLAEQTLGTSDGFPILSKWTEEAAPDEYIDMAPVVSASENGLHVKIPEGVEGDSWKYMVTVDGTEISGTGTGTNFIINNLPNGIAYELKIQSGDGERQLNAVYGTITPGAQGGSVALSDLQQAIANKVKGDAPLTWLFMGDSITHAALWTNGYDGIAQIMEKYVREDLGRTDDVFINTGNSGATAGVEKKNSTLANIEQRLTKYIPDIVILMIGTNDAGANASTESYKANLESIVEKMKEINPDVSIILRSPTPARSGVYPSKIESGYLEAMKSVADKKSAIYIDQYTEWKKEFDTYPYLWGGNYYFGSKTKANDLHPGAAGQLRLAKQLIAACGLNTNTEIANLSYQFACAEAQNVNLPEVFIFQNEIQVYRNSLQGLLESGETIGDYTVVLTDQSTGRTYTKHAGVEEDRLVIGNLPASRDYTMMVTVRLAGSTAKKVNFASQEITLSENVNPLFLTGF